MRKYLRMSKKSSTFAPAFQKKEWAKPFGAPGNLPIFGESESTAKIHMSYIVTNRIEPSLARRAGWMSDLVSGLQNRIERFDSATGLQAARKWAALILHFDS